jgi:hypothetical protein
MSVLMIAPTRSDLPNVAIEAAAVVNALGGKLVQGQVTERDIRDAASAGEFSGIWFATHAGCDRVLLSGDEYLTEAALVAYVAASGARWCFLNTCQSINLGQRIIDETAADTICTIAANPDIEAMRTGVLFARQLALLGDTRAAYERSKPGGNRLYVYLGNYRQRNMAIANRPELPAQDRLLTTMDELRKDISGVVTEVALLKAKTSAIEERLVRIEQQLRTTVTWQSWLLLLIGMGVFAVVVLFLTRNNG